MHTVTKIQKLLQDAQCKTGVWEELTWALRLYFNPTGTLMYCGILTANTDLQIRIINCASLILYVSVITNTQTNNNHLFN
jgi:hypothetical protein